MSCQDDANFTGPVSLFCGVETAHWNQQQFLDVAHFAKSHGIGTLFIKVFEVGSTAGAAHGGMWYGGIDAWDQLYQHIQAIINVIPYGFLWGIQGDINAEIKLAAALLQKYQKICLDIEGKAWEGPQAAAAAQQLAQALHPVPGKLWLSYPADFDVNNQSGTIQALSHCTNVWMPMAYNDKLTSVAIANAHKVNPQACIHPTLHLSNEFGANDALGNAKKMKDAGCLAVSLWYQAYAHDNPRLVDQIVSLYGHGPAVVTPLLEVDQPMRLDSAGCVVTVTKSFQLMPDAQGHKQSGDLCGPWSAMALNFAVQAGGQPLENALQVDALTGQMVDSIWQGKGITHINFPGVDPSDMINILNYLRDKYGRIHYQVISGMDNVIKAIKAGYPTLISCNEADITAWHGNQWVHAYPWSLSAGHVLPATGIDHQGNLICPDQLNNAYQGYWPPIYKTQDIAKSLSWACIVKLPFLKDIPSG